MKPERTEVLAQGMLAGFIGYVTVILFVGTASVAAGKSPFHVPALLGGILFYGVRDAGELVVRAGPVFAFNGLHLLVFLFVGMVAAWLAHAAERGPQLWFLGAFLFLFVLAHILGALQLLTEGVRADVPIWMIAGATLAAVAAIVSYLLAVHPQLRQGLRGYQE
jgi:hypothetical protein